MIRIVLADDHAIVREGLRALLNAEPDMAVVDTVERGLQVEARVAEHLPDVLVLDLGLPDVNGAEVLRRVRSSSPGVAVVILSTWPEDHFALQLLRTGAAAYLHKVRRPEEIITAIRKVAQSGGRYLTDTLAELSLLHSSERPPHELLSPRAQQIFRLLVSGRTVTEVAAELDLTTSTVSTHVGAIKARLAVGSVADIVAYASRAGLLSA